MMRKSICIFLACCLLLALSACGDAVPEAAPEPKETSTPAAASIPTEEPSPTPAPTAAPTPLPAPTPIPDTEDRPANMAAAPENTWVEVDYDRDGIPFDPDAPARDGHTHDWVLDESRTYQGTCNDPGPYTMVCSVCGRELVSRTYYGEHEYRWHNTLLNSWNGNGTHEYSCIHCGDVQSRGSHQWTRASETSNEMVCIYCGASWYRQLPGGN